MPDWSIKVENLSKLYRIGLKEQHHETFVGASIDFLRSPIRNLKDLRGLTNFTESDADSENVIWALRDVSFEVAEGEVLGVIGANGAGKSTLLKILAGITEPTSGRALVEGRIASLLEVGTGFHPDLTGRENIYLNGTILGMTKAEVDRKFDEIVAFSGVEKFIDTPVKRYSSGMKVRLAFAVAAHLEPEILLVDEVLAVGDAEFQKKCLGRIEDITRGGRTVLFVSHDLGAVRMICREAAFFSNGSMVRRGAAKEVVEEYLDPKRDSIPIALSKDPAISVLGYRLVDASGREAKFFDNTSKAAFEIDYRIETSIRHLLLGFDFLTANGATVFRTYDIESPSKDERIPGLYRSRFVINLNPLNPGNYILQIRIGIHRERWISKDEGSAIMTISGRETSDVHYEGIVRPLGEWEILEI
jgi:lipopolysaccharide transport system ATP-binding protein